MHAYTHLYTSWEQWILRVVVNNTPRPMSDNSAAVIERQRLQDTAEGMLRAVLMQIFDIAGGDIQHIPPVMYEFEILSTKRVDERENVYARVANMPSLIHLGNWMLLVLVLSAPLLEQKGYLKSTVQ